MKLVLYALGNASLFTTPDLSRGFLKIQVAEQDLRKPAFTCFRCLFDFTRMPFGFSNFLSTFQCFVDTFLETRSSLSPYATLAMFLCTLKCSVVI